MYIFDSLTLGLEWKCVEWSFTRLRANSSYSYLNLSTSYLRRVIYRFEKKMKKTPPPITITKVLVISWLAWLCILVDCLWQTPLVDGFESVLTTLFGLHVVYP